MRDLEPHMSLTLIFLEGDPPPQPASPPGEASDTAEIQRSRPTVLVVDDEELIVETMGEILEGAGFQVIGVHDAWTALEKIAHRRPDYVLSDVSMPQMNGVQLAIAIRKMYPSTRIILFSGQAGISDILLDGQRQGFQFELIAKPIHPLDLIKYLKEQ
jgi:CheY-like chemotaxis protein